MNLLIDPQTFLWWLDDPSLLAESAVVDDKSLVYVSAAVAWEISIERSLGMLDAPEDLEAAMEAKHVLPQPVTVPHALAVATLPDHHHPQFAERCSYVPQNVL